MGKQYVQGDIFFEECSHPNIFNLERAVPIDGVFVIAKGEKTGHAHVFSEEDGELKSSNAQLFLVVNKDNAEVRHDEHPPLKLPHGLYEVKRQREFDYKSHYHRVVED